jgi:hypothetical protein
MDRKMYTKRKNAIGSRNTAATAAVDCLLCEFRVTIFILRMLLTRA